MNECVVLFVEHLALLLAMGVERVTLSDFTLPENHRVRGWLILLLSPLTASARGRQGDGDGGQTRYKQEQCEEKYPTLGVTPQTRATQQKYNMSHKCYFLPQM